MGIHETTSERWMPVEGYFKYKVSNLGRVMDTDIGKIQRVKKDITGHPVVTLNPVSDAPARLYVHQLVGLAFFGEFRRTHHLRHIDQNKTNNKLANLSLRRGGRKRNMMPGVLLRGKEPVSVRVVETGEVFNSVAELVRYIKGSYSAVQAVLHGRRQSHKGLTFEYYNQKKA